MKIVGRMITILWAGLMASMAGAAVAALSMKQRIVPKAAPDADEVVLAAIFEPIAFESTAGSFRGGRVDLWYGGGVIDLRKATLDPAGARLDVRTVFGGAQVLVPETWNVTTNIRGIGGAGDGRTKIDRALDAPRLTIEGSAFFGGLGVTSDMPAEAQQSLRDAVARRQHNGHTEPSGVPVMETEPVTTV
ncbi:MAG TPA: hypothetical protein VK867_02910 [Candidatus Limnocylindrales bacterium]|nr:hypothetical protein [Candidatus Limnocylindrales bacterium]